MENVSLVDEAGIGLRNEMDGQNHTNEDESNADGVNDDCETERDNADMFDATQAAPRSSHAHRDIPSVQLAGVTIRAGDVVELLNDTNGEGTGLISGDFLLIRSLHAFSQPMAVRLQGFRMRRCARVRPMLDHKLNDLVMILCVQDDSMRSRFEQGLESIALDQIAQKRDCNFTPDSYPLLNFSHVNTAVPANLSSDTEKKAWVFHRGQLVCRYIWITDLYPNGQHYGGEVRHLYAREAAAFTQNKPLSQQPPKRNVTPHPVSEPSSPWLGAGAEPKHRLMPQKSKVYTLGDCYCGAGGVSAGARQAGFHISWGLDLDEIAMAAYAKNFPEAKHLSMDAHDFASTASPSIRSVDHLHLSCPCRYWSQAHTRKGKDDEASIATLFTIEPILRKVQPDTFSLEQSTGLITVTEHRPYFFRMIEGIVVRLGYQIRWKLQDQAWFGQPQHRIRLICVGSKTGIPLAPFPTSTHGPPKSGLLRYVTIADALQVVERQSLALRNDPYHQPQRLKKLSEEPFDPNVRLAKCVTTSGGDNIHHSGTRQNTVRELAAFQGFPVNYHFAGSVTNARRQAGNAWCVASNRRYFEVWAAHREAFDNGLIDKEDEVLDLRDYLDAKGISVPALQAQGIKFRYLHKVTKSIKPKCPMPLWGKRRAIDPLPPRQRPTVILQRQPATAE